jgi:putative phosphoribosyl transferase
MTRAVEIDLDEAVLRGDLTLPPGAEGLVIFAHGSGSSRLSPRNRFVAGVMNREGLGTLLMDLLTEDEESVDDVTRELRFDIDLLGRRVARVVEWARGRPELSGLAVGLFGSSTGAAAALVAAAELPGDGVQAVVSRGGRPDLAGAALPRVECPTLLIVGGLDDVVIGLNEQARARMRCPTELRIVPGATHLFEEPGTLEHVARLAAEWFARHLAGVERAAGAG